MKKLAISLTLISLITSTVTADEAAPAAPVGETAGYASRNATTLSVMGWGISLAVGVAALCALIPNHATQAHQ